MRWDDTKFLTEFDQRGIPSFLSKSFINMVINKKVSDEKIEYIQACDVFKFLDVIIIGEYFRGMFFADLKQSVEEDLCRNFGVMSIMDEITRLVEKGTRLAQKYQDIASHIDMKKRILMEEEAFEKAAMIHWLFCLTGLIDGVHQPILKPKTQESPEERPIEEVFENKLQVTEDK